MLEVQRGFNGKIMPELDINGRTTDAARTLSAGFGGLIVKSPRQKYHQTFAGIKIVLNLLPFQLPLLNQASNLLTIHPVFNRSSQPFGAILEHRRRIVHRERESI